MGGIGLKIVYLIEGHADVYLHLVRKLRLWDTVAPMALATRAGLRLCSLRGEDLRFDPTELQHRQAIGIGRASDVHEALARLRNLPITDDPSPA